MGDRGAYLYSYYYPHGECWGGGWGASVQLLVIPHGECPAQQGQMGAGKAGGTRF